MPVIEIQALPQDKAIDVGAVMRRIVKSVATTVGVGIDSVFCVWNEIDPDRYVIGDRSAQENASADYPVLVRVTLFEGRNNDVISATLAMIAEELRQGLRASDSNSFITYFEAKSGQVFTGGHVRYR